MVIPSLGMIPGTLHFQGFLKASIIFFTIGVDPNMTTSSTYTMKKPFIIHDIKGLDALISGGTPSLWSTSQAIQRFLQLSQYIWLDHSQFNKQ
eukprot:12903515-Prorocentrum_lima.AAC.1